MVAEDYRQDGHKCPSYVLDHEECELINQTDQYEYEHYADHSHPEDAFFWVPHQHEDRLVRFNRLTVTIDEIITRCEYPEKAREQLATLHRQLAEEFLKDYRGPLRGPVPLLEEPRSAMVG